MKLLSLMLLRNHLPPSPHLMTLALRKVVPPIRTVGAGKVKEIGRRTGEKPMQEKGSLHFLLSILPGWLSVPSNFLEAFFRMENLKWKLSMLYSGEIQAVRGIDKSLSIGQVVWAPSSKGMHQYLVFVGWSSGRRKLGIKYCYNRPCALYTIRAPLWESGIDGLKVKWVVLYFFPPLL